jgi:hypothetical protein
VVLSIVRLLRLASFIVCAILLTSFAFFAVDQTRSASARQSESLGPSLGPALASASTGPTSAPAHAPSSSPVRGALDDAANTLTAPFSGIVPASHSEWAVRISELLIALLAYGFGLGYLARVLRIRV